ncbi:hypothetical protein [Ruegeria jejuensis]|uniref:hypothetical protein n=1 Tax=Ruegeria jejuensis TaxID=3233338 RepID=UPI00355B2458
MKDGDIYNWLWKDGMKRNDFGAFQSYHCYSRIAIARDGKLYDTFWSDNSKPVDVTAVDLRFLGNANEMTVINKWKVPYYRPDDVVDTRHSNDYSAPIYLKAGAQKDPETMRENVLVKRAEAQREIKSSQQTVEEMDKYLAAIEAGDLDSVYL